MPPGRRPAEGGTLLAAGLGDQAKGLCPDSFRVGGGCSRSRWMRCGDWEGGGGLWVDRHKFCCVLSMLESITSLVHTSATPGPLGGGIGCFFRGRDVFVTGNLWVGEILDAAVWCRCSISPTGLRRSLESADWNWLLFGLKKSVQLFDNNKQMGTTCLLDSLDVSVQMRRLFEASTMSST